MAWWDGLIQNLFQRDQIDGPLIGDELNPIGAFYAQQMQLGSQRLKRYKDFSDMAADTLISGALNIYSDEISQYDRVQGASIWPIARNQQVTKLLKLMLDKIRVEDYLFGVARYLACMGDNFVRPLFSSTGGGIVGMEFMDAEDVDRVVDKFNRLVGFRYGGGRKLLDPWAFVHFRLMSRTQSVKLGGGIYGTSMLEDARRTWRQLTLLEDALVIYRLELGGRHRVFYIDVGNAPYDRALRTVRQYKREFGKRQYYNPTSGEYTSRFNPLHLTSDIFWPVRQGSESRIDYMGTDPNISSIVDLDWFRNKLFAALKIPKSYIGGDDYASSRVGLAQIDVNFARLIKRLQRALIVGFYRMGQLHLAVNGVDPLDPNNDFEICMSVISSLDQEQRLMSMDLSLQIAQKLRDMGLAMGIDDETISAYVARHVLGLSPYDLRVVGQEPNTMPSPGQINSGDEPDAIDPDKLMEAVAVLRQDPEINRLVGQIRRWTEVDAPPAREDGARVPEAAIDQEALHDENRFNLVEDEQGADDEGEEPETD